MQQRTMILVGLGILGVATIAGVLNIQSQQNTSETYSPTVRTVEQAITISGRVEAPERTDLRFSQAGIVRELRVAAGSSVAVGDKLAVLNQDESTARLAGLSAERQKAEARYQELLTGATAEARAVAATSLTAAQIAASETEATETARKNSARTDLLSSNLTAVATDPDTEAPAPTIAGSYQCQEEGVYEISFYRSDSESEYSYRLTGLETGTFPASARQPAALGDCGLTLTLTDQARYHNSVWTVSIPNTTDPTYPTRRSEYELIVSQADQAIAAAEQTLAIRSSESAVTNADPLAEVLSQQAFTIAQIDAQIREVQAARDELVLTAPVSGIVADTTFMVGELARTDDTLTILPERSTTMTALVPERHIQSVVVGQSAAVGFDASPDERFAAVITASDLLPTFENGVTYYEVTLTLAAPPEWIREGMNADIDVITDSREQLAIPRRYLIATETGYAVYTETATGRATTTIEVDLLGTDGYAAISGLDAATKLIAP